MIEEVNFDQLLSFNLDEYVEWVLTHKESTRADKMHNAKNLATNGQWQSDYRKALDEVFFKTGYWKAPSLDEKLNFKYWREKSFDFEFQFFYSSKEANIWPLSDIIERENKRVINSLQDRYSASLLKLYNKWLFDDYYEMAYLIGKIDFLKHINADRINKPKSENIAIDIVQRLEKKIDEIKLSFAPKKVIINKRSTITAPIIAAFCAIVNDLKIIPIGGDTKESYCKRVCSNFSLTYTDKVRQNYSADSKVTKKHANNVVNLILPTIDIKYTDQIKQHLTSKGILYS